MTASATPTTKAARHGMIRELLANHAITSQAQLRELLAEVGIDTTQATLSRDLMDLRATKVRNREGVQVYTVPDVDGGQTHEAKASHNRLQRWCQELLVTTDCVDNQLILRTTIGAANLLGSAIDSARLEEVVGTLAGDDTVFVLCRSAQSAREIQSHLLKLAVPFTE
ncbi:MAG: arginine repressor [Actinobacteria bacterium]|nr:MAG: arginine repressor [Actinomycetota bacterium]